MHAANSGDSLMHARMLATMGAKARFRRTRLVLASTRRGRSNEGFTQELNRGLWFTRRYRPGVQAFPSLIDPPFSRRLGKSLPNYSSYTTRNGGIPIHNNRNVETKVCGTLSRSAKSIIKYGHFRSVLDKSILLVKSLEKGFIFCAVLDKGLHR
ncbi:transcriptional regulator [Striga asiatica]|uniref:Transcriptional regulator n=1 Tax=Striga asiatica TaxID=4170 RepID=A0A5A7QLB2_STRAF|nr:transcriptional regulator [Striga asiatica]